MNSEKKYDSSIDLGCFFKRLLEQWRGWTLCGLMFGMLFVLLVCYKQTQTASRESYLFSSTSSLGGGDVSQTLSYFRIWKWWTDYVNEAPVMALDGECVKKLTLNYYISGDGIDNCHLADYYTDFLSDEEFFSALSDALGYGSNYRFFSDIIYCDGNAPINEISTVVNKNINVYAINRTSLDINNTKLTITVLLPKESDEEMIQNTISDYLLSKSTALIDTIGTHEISFVASEMIISPDSSVIYKQSCAIQNYYYYRNLFYTSYNSLDSSSKNTVDNTVINLLDGTMSYDEVIEEYPSQIVSSDKLTMFEDTTSIVDDKDNLDVKFDYRYAFAGFVAGIFLYAGIVLLWDILFRRFRSGEDASHSLGLRSYGDIYCYPYKGVKKFFHDRNVYNRIHRFSSTPEKVAESIVAKAEFCSLNKISYAVLGDGGAFVQEAIDHVKSYANKSGLEVDVHIIPCGLKTISEKELCCFNPTFISIISGQTDPVHAFEILSMLNEYKVSVFGITFIEGPI